MSRTTTIAFVAILLTSSILIIQYTSAMSTPSVPQFTVKQVDRSYEAPTTYTTNPYTGETITHQGHHVANLTIEITIKNQPIPTITNGYNTTGIFYNVQARNHMDDWTTAYNDERNKYTIKPSTSENTVVTFILDSDGLVSSPGGQLDVRVQAVMGTEFYVFSRGGGIIPIGTQFALESASDWSSTQTITIGSGEVITSQPTSQPTQNTTAAPTQTNTEGPTQLEVTATSGLTWKDIVIVAAFVVIAALAAALVLTRRKKP